jgi:photosystem II stability/assembly factor-like uncharacterized protein
MQRIKIHGVGFLLAVTLILSLGYFQGSPVQAQPVSLGIDSVQPDQIMNDLDTPVTIDGSGFSNTGGDPQAFLGRTALKDVQWVDEHTLTAQIPWGIAPGSYAMRVVNPDGEEISRSSAVTVAQGIGQWTSGDLFGGPIDAVVPDPSHAGWLYAYSTHTSALYRSEDAGAHWVTRGHVPGGQFLTMDPKDTSTLFVGSARSTDGGVTWDWLLENNQWPGSDKNPGWYTWVFPHPTVNGTIFMAAANLQGADDSAFGLLRSVDNGQTWQTVQTGIDPGDENVTALEFSPDDPQTIYIGTRDGNLYKSTDGGDNWSPLGHMLASIGILKINPGNHQELWITTQFQVTPQAQMIKVQLSDLSHPAQIWTGHQDSYPTRLGFIDVHTAYLATRWDNVWLTIDGGGLWSNITPTDGKVGNDLALDPTDATHQTFYAADEQYGVQKTTDSGQTWQPVRDGLRAMAPDHLVVDPANPSRVYAKITENGWPGIFISENGGSDWTYSPLKAGERPQPSALAINSQRIFVGTHGDHPGLYYSADQAATWNFVDVDPQPLFPTDFYMPWTIQADPSHDATLLMTVVIGNREITTDHYFSEIYRSTNNGDTWQRIGLEAQVGRPVYNLTSLAFDPHDSQTVYASGDKDILKSSDNGLTWTVVRADKGNNGAAMIVEPVAPYRIFMGNQVSADGGATWTWINTPMGANQMAFVPGTDTVYIASGGLARSDDGGNTWQVSPGDFSAVTITALAIVQVDQRTVVYVGTPGGDGAAGSSQTALHPQSSSVLEAGVYRLTQVKQHLFLPKVSH